MLRRFLIGLSWFAVPIALPAWLFESLYRRISGRFWEFRIWSGTVYILVLVVLSTIGVFSVSIVAQVLALYIFSALEVVSLAMCFGILLGDLGDYRALLRELTRRKTRPAKFTSIHVRTIWIALTSFMYTAFYFAILTYLLYSFDKTLYIGAQGQSTLEIFFDFLFFSYISMTLVGFTAITPIAVFSKILYMVQVTLALFFVLFIFALLANDLMGQRSPK